MTAPHNETPTGSAPGAPRLDRLIRRADLPIYTGLHRTQIAAKIAAGEFPAPVPISDSGRAVAWLESELIEWQQRRIAARGRFRTAKQSADDAEP